MAGSTLELSQINIDFPGLVEQLQTHLNTKNAWKGFLTTETGETLLEMIAAVGALDQMKILRYYQDAFPFTALSDTAVYAIATMQGVRINRKLPMSIDVSLTSPSGEVLISELSQFSVAGVAFFNRDPLIVGTTPGTYTLHEGTMSTTELLGLGTPYQTYLSKETGFTVSDIDVKVEVNDVEIARSTEGLWKLKNQAGYRDRTLPNGRLQLEFGNQQYGTMPNNNDLVRISYAITKGLDLRDLKTTGKKVAIDTFPSIAGYALTNPSNGGNEPSADLYRTLSAASFGTFGSAVTKQQYLSTALSYPGVVDALTFSQREVNPNSSTWMNLVKVVLLTSEVWNTPAKEAFATYMHQRSMYSTRIFIEDPVEVPIALDVSIYCHSWANAEQCKIDAIAALQNLFAKKEGQLGKDIYRSDIHNTALNSNKGIEYVVINSPAYDLLVSLEGIAGPTVTANAAATGSIPPGTFYYAVSPVLVTGGEIAPRNFVRFDNMVESTRLTISWTPYEGASQYKVWGRSADGVGLLMVQSATLTPSFLDDGVFTPTVGTPATSTAPVRLLQLSSLTVRTNYSTRTGRSQPV